MFRSRSWFGTGWGRPKNPHSLEHLKYLYNVLSRNQTVSEHNRGLLVESLRSIAEILIWGDQNDSSVFDFFLEKNMLSFFLRIMRQRSGGSSFVCVQLLQTLNILFENIRNETSLYYLLSNNHVNSIIVHKFDFSDEEVMAYYISFLKTLSLKLNAHTIHFFYNEHTNDFPLYTEAIKFFNHPESMVRIAVRTLTLNVYKVEDASMLAFIRDRTAAPYFSNIVWFIGKHIHELDTCVRNDADHQSQNRLADMVAEHLDHLHYLNDILCLKIPDVNQVLTEHLLHKLMIPMYIYSLNAPSIHNQENSIEAVTQNLAKILNRKVNLPEVAPEKDSSNGKVSCVVALFLLSQVFLIISHAPLIETLSWIILRTDRVQFEKGVGKLLDLYKSEYQKGKHTLTPIQQPDNVPSSSKTNARLSRSSSPATTHSANSQTHINPSACIIRANSDSDSGDSTGASGQGTVCNGTPTTSNDSNITDEQKQLQLTTDGSCTEPGQVSGTSSGNGDQHHSHSDKPFLMVVLDALDCTENDYSALFALSLLYAMANNKGVQPDLLERILRPKKSVSRSSQPSLTAAPSTSTSTTSSTTAVKDVKYTYNLYVVDQLLHIVMHACQPSCRVRLVTLELALRLLAQMVTCDGKNILTEAHRACMENARAQSVALLRNFYKSEEIFLDMFEHEYYDMSRTCLNVEWLCMDSAILLPPTGTPLTGIDFTKRLPCGEVERARRAIRVFFLVRDTVLALQSDVETQLPLTNPQSCVHIDQALDLSIARCVS